MKDRINEWIENLRREMVPIKIDQVDILGPEDTVPDIKHTLYEINSRLDTIEERISKLEYKVIEMIQTEAYREKKKKNK